MTKRRQTRHRAFDPDPDAPGRICDMPGCTADAGYRAPKHRRALREYYWFCLEHVREYNSNWDFYKGMTAAQIESQLQSDSSWQRPSWKLGSLGTATRLEEHLADPLGLLRRKLKRGASRVPLKAEDNLPPAPVRQQLEVLGLSWPLSFEQLRTHYRRLARKHHPDANLSDPLAEARFKEINVAYTMVKTFLASK